jgi:hypothetical protein
MATGRVEDARKQVAEQSVSLGAHWRSRKRRVVMLLVGNQQRSVLTPYFVAWKLFVRDLKETRAASPRGSPRHLRADEEEQMAPAVSLRAQLLLHSSAQLPLKESRIRAASSMVQ